MDCHVDDDKIVLKKHGKSFHWASKFLNKECINRAAELYSFCRILDDIADSGETNSHKYLINIKSIINYVNLSTEEENKSASKEKQKNELEKDLNQSVSIFRRIMKILL